MHSRTLVVCVSLLTRLAQSVSVSSPISILIQFNNLLRSWAQHSACTTQFAAHPLGSALLVRLFATRRGV